MATKRYFLVTFNILKQILVFNFFVCFIFSQELNSNFVYLYIKNLPKTFKEVNNHYIIFNYISTNHLFFRFKTSMSH